MACVAPFLVQSEAACALSNIAAGMSEHTRVVIENGAVPIFVHLLASPSDFVRLQVRTQGQSPSYALA